MTAHLDVADFDAYFAAINGFPPFAWQRRLVNVIATTGAWPAQIGAPTGAGKSTVVEIHVFVNALAASGSIRVRPPRRLAYVVGRRALVDNGYERALGIQEQLANASEGVLGRVAEALARWITSPDLPPLIVSETRGELPRDDGWLDHPEACTILAATPQMWGSSLLLRGYGRRRQARPRAAGLAAMDSVIVLDEAHLNRQLMTTAQSVQRLEGAFAAQLGIPPLQVVEMTATPAAQAESQSVGVAESDLASEPELNRRVTASKAVAYRGTQHWPGNRAPTRAYIEYLCDSVERVRGEASDAATVLAMVNRVQTATLVGRALAARGLRVAVIAGPMRRADRDRLSDAHPGLFDVRGAKDVDVLVSTQVLEVGVDLDAAGLVTELAPGSALAQRAGRVNRRGRRSHAPVLVIGPETRVDIPDDVAPYTAEDLRAARAWILALELGEGGISPWAVFTQPPNTSTPRRLLFQRVEQGDLSLLSRTTSANFAEHDLALWTDDDLSRESPRASVVVRRLVPDEDSQALAILASIPPTTDEEFPGPLWEVRKVVERVLEAAERARAFLVRAGTVTQCESAEEIRPGDVVILDAIHPVQSGNILSSATDAETTDDVFFELERRNFPDPIHQVKLIQGRDHETIDRIKQLVEISESDDATPWADPRQIEIGPEDADGQVQWVVLRPDTRQRESEVRQEWTHSTRQVTLGKHNRDVAVRARQLATSIGLPEQFVNTLETAGQWHDAGKGDDRFQQMLGRREGSPALAKSRRRTEQQVRRAHAGSGLPARWRHEQASVTFALDSQPEHRPDDLVLRLIGTSHGNGRPFFPHTSEELHVEERLREVAATVFDDGTWDYVVDATHRDFGVWGCAYLEALLRAADIQISKEGR